MAKSPSSKSKKSQSMSTKKIVTLEDIEKKYGRPTYGESLHAWRVCDELSLSEMAKLLGMTRASLHDIEKGRRIPSPARAAKIARKMGLPITSWVKSAIQDQLDRDSLNLRIELHAV